MHACFIIIIGTESEQVILSDQLSGNCIVLSNLLEQIGEELPGNGSGADQYGAGLVGPGPAGLRSTGPWAVQQWGLRGDVLVGRHHLEDNGIGPTVF